MSKILTWLEKSASKSVEESLKRWKASETRYCPFTNFIRRRHLLSISILIVISFLLTFIGIQCQLPGIIVMGMIEWSLTILVIKQFLYEKEYAKTLEWKPTSQ